MGRPANEWSASEVWRSLSDESGYTIFAKIRSDQLEFLRQLIHRRWLSRVKDVSPAAYNMCAETSLNNYHLVANHIKHHDLMRVKNRSLTKDDVSEVKKLDFFKNLVKVFGEFLIEDAIGVEMNWRITRPNEELDVFPIHADSWYLSVQNGTDAFRICRERNGNLKWSDHNGKLAQNFDIIHAWIPLYCIPGKNGLAVVPESQKREWKYGFMELDPYGGALKKFELQEELPKEAVKALEMNAGDVLLFHDRLLHKGMVNQGNETRLALLFNMYIPNKLGAYSL